MNTNNFKGSVYENFTVRWGVFGIRMLGVKLFQIWEFFEFEDICIDFIHASVTWKAQILDDHYGPQRVLGLEVFHMVFNTGLSACKISIVI